MNVNYPVSARLGGQPQTGTRGDKMRISGQHSANTAQNATYQGWGKVKSSLFGFWCWNLWPSVHLIAAWEI